MKTCFLFFVADHQLVGQLCTNPKSDRSLLSCLKVTQCSTSELGDAPLYNSCSLPIQVMTAEPLPAPSKCKCGRFNTWGHSSTHRTTLWMATVMVFGVVSRRATSCHLTSSKSAWNSTPKCTWMCWRVWWSPVAVRLPGCGSRTRRRPTSPKKPRLGFRRSAKTLYPSLTGPPPPPTVSILQHINLCVVFNTSSCLYVCVCVCVYVSFLSKQFVVNFIFKGVVRDLLFTYS